MSAVIRVTTQVHLIRYDSCPADALSIPCPLCKVGVSQPCIYNGRDGSTLVPSLGSSTTSVSVR